MDSEQSFIGNVKGLQELKSIGKRAHFQYIQGILQNKGDINDCDLLMVWKSTYKHKFAMAVKKRSKYYEPINKILMTMDTSGQLFRLHKKYFKELQECKTSGVKSIGYDKLGAVFILLAGALFLSFNLMLMELLSKYVLKRYKMNNKNGL